MESTFEQVVIDALDALESGADVDAILARFPDNEVELKPILLTAASLTRMRVAHSLEAQAASRQRMLDYAASATSGGSQAAPLLVLVRRLSLVLGVLLFAVMLLGTGILFASAQTVPGDAFYGAKRLFENARLSLTSDKLAREELQQQLEETRAQEVRTLLRMGRSEEVTFEGTIEAIDGDSWTVAGIEVVILDTTSLSGVDSPAAGYLARVSGKTADGHVIAKAIVVRRVGDAPELAPDPDSEDAPGIKPTKEGPVKNRPTATHTPTPTATPEQGSPESSPPTSTPALPSDGNDNGGQENGNENEAEPNENGGDNSNDSDENDGGNSNDSNDNDRGNSNHSNENNGNGNDNDNDDDHEENDNDDNENHNVNG